jgi:sulfate adenylyltransferase subunit 2
MTAALALEEAVRPSPERLTHLRQLEAESIHVLREVVAELERPVMLYSIGKDSSVMVRLAQKAFHPGPLPFPLLHVDTTWKFRAMYELRDRFCKEQGFELIVHKNEEALSQGINPFDHGSQKYTTIMKTQGLLQPLAKYGFDAAFGGARRDEEKSRAKERILSFRDRFGQWDPKSQRPELWNLYNGRIRKGEHVRVFPLSNWTELDVWEYIDQEQLEVPLIYFAHDRRVFRRDGMIYAWREGTELIDGEEVFDATVRYRTVGDMSCTGGVLSNAATLEDVVLEIAATRITERGETRADDRVSEAAMEDRKKAGYF